LSVALVFALACRSQPKAPVEDAAPVAPSMPQMRRWRQRHNHLHQDLDDSATPW
jgi:hypothetical protein